MHNSVVAPHTPSTNQSVTKPTLLTLCEVLADLKSNNGRIVSLVGRLTNTDEGAWLSADNCPNAHVTADFIWPNMVWLREDPSLPSLASKGAIDARRLDEAFVKAKEAAKLRGPNDRWAIVQGIFETRERLETVLSLDGKTVRGYGYGHLNAAPAQLVFNKMDLKFLPSKR